MTNRKMCQMKKNGIRCLVLLLAYWMMMLNSVGFADYSFSHDPDAIEKAADSVFMLEIYSSDQEKIGVGSGFVALEKNIIVTNYHVIEGGAYIIAISDDGEQYLLTEICIADQQNDIAMLHLQNDHNVEPLVLDAQYVLKRAQPVVAIGSPAGLMNTISIGNISAFYQKDGKDWIQFTAPISSGSSGGALFNDEGNVIGITTATYTSAQNINMAVKAEDVAELYKKWDGHTFRSMNDNESVILDMTSLQSQDESENTQDKVYVSLGGKKYHNNPFCSGMRNPVEMDLLDAIEQGYEPCGKCYR